MERKKEYGDSHLGKTMLDIRKRHRRKQEDVAKGMQVKPEKLGRFERGEQLPTRGELKRFCDVVEATQTEVKKLRELYLQPLSSPEEILYGQIPLAQFYPSRETAYRAVLSIIDQISTKGEKEKRVLHSVLHGHIGRRILTPSQPDPVIEAFDKMMLACITSLEWYVREVVNITKEERLKITIDRLEKTRDAKNFELRAVSFPDAPSLFSPLVIGNRDLLIGWEEMRYYRVGCAIHLHGQDFAKIGSEYFDALWEDQRIFVLRSESGIDPKEIERLRGKIRESERQGKTY